MTATAIVILTCLLLHRSGVLNKFLTACKVSADPEPIPETPQKPPNTRRQLEADASYILTKQGYKTPETVAYMGDEMLTNIIREYLGI